jgi:hypothetical protein
MVLIKKYITARLGKKVNPFDYITHYVRGVLIDMDFTLIFCGDDTLVFFDSAKYEDFADVH